MTKAEQRALIAAGWRIGSAQDFLELTDEEAGIVELRVRRSDALHERRTRST